MKQQAISVNSEKQARFIKTGVAAAVLGVSTNTVRAAVRRGDLPGIELGSQVLVSREGLERLVARAAVTTEPASVA
jgi:excisionase family DNA binding protein